MTQQNIYTLSDTTATKITPNGTHSGMDITIQNINASGYIYIGNDDVTDSAFGYRLLPNHAWSIELPGRDELWLTAETNGMQAAVLITSLEQQD
jgi:hypothetical protein